jgi:hypothetical protein
MCLSEYHSFQNQSAKGKTALTPLRLRCLGLEDEGSLVTGATICASLASQAMSELPRLFSVS